MSLEKNYWKNEPENQSNKKKVSLEKNYQKNEPENQNNKRKCRLRKLPENVGCEELPLPS